jgi:hypothetical protein
MWSNSPSPTWWTMRRRGWKFSLFLFPSPLSADWIEGRHRLGPASLRSVCRPGTLPHYGPDVWPVGDAPFAIAFGDRTTALTVPIHAAGSKRSRGEARNIGGLESLSRWTGNKAGNAGLYHRIEPDAGGNAVPDLLHGLVRQGRNIEILANTVRGDRRRQDRRAALHRPGQGNLRWCPVKAPGDRDNDRVLGYARLHAVPQGCEGAPASMLLTVRPPRTPSLRSAFFVLRAFFEPDVFPFSRGTSTAINGAQSASSVRLFPPHLRLEDGPWYWLAPKRREDVCD